MTEFLQELAYFASQLTWISAIDISLVALVILSVLQLVRGTQAAALLRGIIFLIIVITLLTQILRLQAFSWLLGTILPALVVAIPVIFAPEIRRALERIGRATVLLDRQLPEGEADAVIDALATAAHRLSERRHGALIVIERQSGLKEYIDTGMRLDASVTAQLLLQIFYPNTPMHDGAVIIQGSRITAAGCVMPLTTNPQVTGRQIGLRHRAALGTTEATDAVAVVVSEETGIISVVHNGHIIRPLDRERLRNVLSAFYKPVSDRSFAGTVRSLLRAARGNGSRNNVNGSAARAMAAGRDSASAEESKRIREKSED